MSFLQENSSLHEKTFELDVPYAWRDLAVWRLISEFQRRHPAEFDVIDGYGREGLGDTNVWFVTHRIGGEEQIKSNLGFGDSVLAINAKTSIFPANHGHPDHRCAINRGLPEDAHQYVNTLDIVLSPNWRAVVPEIESCLGISSPSISPATTRASIGARFIAAALAQNAFGSKPLRVQGYLKDAVERRMDLASKFAPFEIDPEDKDPRRHGAGLFFLSEPTENSEFSEVSNSLLAVDIAQGIAYVGNEQIDLYDTYDVNNRDITSLATEIVALARRASKN